MGYDEEPNFTVKAMVDAGINESLRRGRKLEAMQISCVSVLNAIAQSRVMVSRSCSVYFFLKVLIEGNRKAGRFVILCRGRARNSTTKHSLRVVQCREMWCQKFKYAGYHTKTTMVEAG